MSRLSRGVVEVPWDSRNALIDRIRQLDAATPTIRTFENVGVSLPVVLTLQQKIELVEMIELWGIRSRVVCRRVCQKGFSGFVRR